MTRRKSFIIFFIFIAINLLSCDKFLENQDYSEDDEQLTNNSTKPNQRIVVEFTSSIVQHEYIVHFRNYYKKDTRRKYITSALDNPEVNVKCVDLYSVQYSLIDNIYYRSKIGR